MPKPIERERCRTLTLDWQRRLVTCIAVLWSLFQLLASVSIHLDSIELGSIHLAFALSLAFFLYHRRKGATETRIAWVDVVLWALGLFGSLYITCHYQTIVDTQGGFPTTHDLVAGSILLLILAIAVVRVSGYPLLIIVTVLMVYALSGNKGMLPFTFPSMLQLHHGYTWAQMVQHLYLTTEGIWGAPLRISATFVFLFVLFGALLEQAGAGEYFITLSYSLLGRYRGGPAKAAVISSFMTGMISGSSISNVVTTGTFTIPLMQKVGYTPEKAAAIEVAASVNGQLMPPVMGAAAFIMADFLGMPYTHIIFYALFPAILSYAGLLMVVHLEAVKLNLKTLSPKELPPFWPTFIRGIHYFIPVLFLLYSLIILRHTPEYSAFHALLVLLALIFIQTILRCKTEKKSLYVAITHTYQTIIKGFVNGAKNMTPIAIATAVAGIVVGVVTITGIGFGLTDIISAISGNHFYLTLVFAALAAMILGLGLPTTANYIVMAALVAPVISKLGFDAGYAIPAIAIHLFVFYFGILADDTPPVGLAAYAGAAIAKTDPIRVGIQSFTYDLRIIILPFAFLLNPQLLFVDVHGLAPALSMISHGLFGMLCFVIALCGQLRLRMQWFERLLLLIATLALLGPHILPPELGYVLFVCVLVFHAYQARRKKATTTR